MLTPRLLNIKSMIESKNEGQRSIEEKELLIELRHLDSVLKKSLEESAIGVRANVITSGPGSRCACCGRA